VTWVAVVNGRAGTKARTLSDLEAAAADAGVDVTFHQTQSQTDVPRVVDEALSIGMNKFIAVGGDGTVHGLVNALMNHPSGTRCRVAVIPSGSGSDLMRTFGHSNDLTSAFARIHAQELYALDLGVITLGDGSQRYFVNVADIGVAADAVRTAQRLPRWTGKIKYTAAFWLTLSRFEVPTVDVAVGRHRFKGPAINIVVANGQFFGGGLNIAPRASMADGQFDVQVFTGRKRQAFAVMPRVLTGSHLTHASVRRYVGSTVIVDGPDDLNLEADGELVGSGPVTIGIVPDAIDLVI
jgi:YegS/Rv2252/BmrU family lipid kinase